MDDVQRFKESLDLYESLFHSMTREEWRALQRAQADEVERLHGPEVAAEVRRLYGLTDDA